MPAPTGPPIQAVLSDQNGPLDLTQATSVKIILKGEQPLTCRPGELLEPIDFTAKKAEIEKKVKYLKKLQAIHCHCTQNVDSRARPHLAVDGNGRARRQGSLRPRRSGLIVQARSRL